MNGNAGARAQASSHGWAGSTITIRCLASAYAAARVFALPSWFETPGLAALEAGLAGCAVAITPYGSTRDYFGDLRAVCPARPAAGDSASRHEMLGRRSRPSVVAVDRDPLSLAERGPDHRGGL